MNTTIVVLSVGAVLLLSLALRFVLQPRVRRAAPRRRYRVFGVLLVVGVGSQAVGAVVAAFSDQTGAEIGFLLTGLLLGAACALEMRKLRREF